MAEIVAGRWFYDQRTQSFIREEWVYPLPFGFARALYDDEVFDDPHPLRDVSAEDEGGGGESDVCAVADTPVGHWDDEDGFGGFDSRGRRHGLGGTPPQLPQRLLIVPPR